MNNDVSRLIQAGLPLACVLSSANDIHGVFTNFTEADFYPEHDKRKESSAYARVHKDMVVKRDMPCLVCGVRHSQLTDNNKQSDIKLNPFAAKQMETHHHAVEWSLANAIDSQKFNQLFRPHLLHAHPEKSLYQSTMGDQDVLAWIDHDEDNLWVLCDVHHRHRFYGIHHVTYPDWVAQNLYKSEFIEALAQKIEQTDKAAQA
jgi:hypothetical protein